MHAVAVPSTLRDRLVAVPGQSRRHALHLPLALAALIAAAIVLVLLVRDTPVEQRLRTLAVLAVLAVHTHVNDPPTLPRREDATALSGELSSRVPFPVRVAPPAAGLRLVGGKCCTFERRPVAYTLWRGPGGPVSLIQFRRSDFQLPPPDPPEGRGGSRGVPGDGLDGWGRRLPARGAGRGAVADISGVTHAGGQGVDPTHGIRRRAAPFGVR